jgi:hypothetical protein
LVLGFSHANTTKEIKKKEICRDGLARKRIYAAIYKREGLNVCEILLNILLNYTIKKEKERKYW